MKRNFKKVTDKFEDEDLQDLHLFVLAKTLKFLRFEVLQYIGILNRKIHTVTKNKTREIVKTKVVGEA